MHGMLQLAGARIRRVVWATRWSKLRVFHIGFTMRLRVWRITSYVVQQAERRWLHCTYEITISRCSVSLTCRRMITGEMKSGAATRRNSVQQTVIRLDSDEKKTFYPLCTGRSGRLHFNKMIGLPVMVVESTKLPHSWRLEQTGWMSQFNYTTNRPKLN